MSMLNSCKSSGKQSADADITTVPTLLYGISLVNGGAACYAVVTDGNGGSEIAEANEGGTTAGIQHDVWFDNPVVCPLGISVNVNGTSAYYYVYYQVYGS